MDVLNTKLTVYFENPFWVGIIEKNDEASLSVCKLVFGSSEPKDYDVYQFVSKNWFNLDFSKKIDNINQKTKVIKNPKRMQRQINKVLSDQGIGTKSQQALKDQYLENKKQNKKLSKENIKLEKERKYLIKQKKKKLKKKGH